MNVLYKNWDIEFEKYGLKINNHHIFQISEILFCKYCNIKIPNFYLIEEFAIILINNSCIYTDDEKLIKDIIE